MEAAAKKVQLLAQRILPDRPHHLSVSPDQRYRVPPDHSKAVEEFKHQRLQYMTLLSDADRGMLLTRPYYDMREEPPNPTATKEPNVKMEKKVVTKLSLSDYKNKQKRPSPSPPDSGATPKTDASRKEALDGRPDREPKKADTYRGRESDALRDAKAHKQRDVPNDDRSTKPEPKSRATQESHDTPEKRKRVPEMDGELRPQKRARPEASTPVDERSRTPRDDTPKRKELHASQDRTPQKDSKSSTASSLTNGRSALKAALGSNANKSPISRARGDSINGNRPSLSSSSRSKADTSSSRTTMPPLLSPLHLPNEGDSHSRDKKRRDDVGDHGKPQRSLKPEPPPPLKRQRSPAKLPSLLSPTLPPMLEEELARMKSSPTKSSTPSQKIQPPESPTRSKRPHIVPKEEDEDRRDLKEKVKEKPRRFMVTLKYSKKISNTVRRLLALPPKKDAIKKERSLSIEPPAPPQARKRPISSTDNVGDSIAVKRPRTSDVASSSKLVTPSTPSKAATSMSRVTSSNSVNTPGDGNSLTPAPPPSADRDRPQTRGDPKEPEVKARVQALRERWGRFSRLGTKLKHERDMLLERKSGDRAAHVSDTDTKLSMILGLETALAFMVSFRALFESRSMENKAQDPKQWASILPLLHVMRHDLRRCRPLEALYYQLQGVIHEELIKCFWSIDPASNAAQLHNYERGRSSIWKSAADHFERVEDGAMRTNMGPWTSVEEAVASALRILRRWAQEENVSWRAEVTVPAANGTSS